MIIFKWGEQLEDRTYSDGKPFACEAFRWTFQIGDSRVEIVHQHKFRGSAEWRDSHTLAYGFGLHDQFILYRKFHDYYDGPHCGIALGWFRVYWGGDPRTGWCKKCMPDNE